MMFALVATVVTIGQTGPSDTEELLKLGEARASVQTIRAGLVQHCVNLPGTPGEFKLLREITWTQKGDWVLAHIIEWKLISDSKPLRRQRVKSISYLKRGDEWRVLDNATPGSIVASHVLRIKQPSDKHIAGSFWRFCHFESGAYMFEDNPRGPLSFGELAQCGDKLGFRFQRIGPHTVAVIDKRHKEEIEFDPSSGAVKSVNLQSDADDRRITESSVVLTTQTHKGIVFPKIIRTEVVDESQAGTTLSVESSTEAWIHEVNEPIDDSEFALEIPSQRTEVAFDTDEVRVFDALGRIRKVTALNSAERDSSKLLAAPAMALGLNRRMVIGAALVLMIVIGAVLVAVFRGSRAQSA